MHRWMDGWVARAVDSFGEEKKRVRWSGPSFRGERGKEGGGVERVGEERIG